MPAAQTKAQLIAVTQKEFDKLIQNLTGIDSDVAQRVHDGTSIKNVIAHRAHWTILFLGWYHDGQAGKVVYFPAKGYKWSDLKRYNADLAEAQSDLSWEDVQTMLRDSYNALIDFIDAHNDVDLYAGPMKGANNNWTAGRWAEAAGASHYRSASKYVRAVLRAVS